ncbi:PAS domain S-box protein [Polaromonas sp.]|nr:PAS domain S-box protein [Candidatus Saccharibacteria bacterium]
MQAPAAIAVVRGPKHVFDFTNSLYLRLVGKTKAIHGKAVRDAFPELKGQGFYELLDTVYETGEPFIGNELPIDLDLNGSGTLTRTYVNFVYQPMKDAEGAIGGIMAHAVDVTAAVEGRLQIREDEERYRTLFNSINQGFCIIELIFDDHNVAQDYKFIEVNHVFEQQTGLKDVVGKTARTVIPNLEDRWVEIYGQVVKTGKPLSFTENSDAMGRWYEVDATRLGNPKSNCVAILFTDITKRKTIEDTLRQSEALNRTVIESLEEGVSLLDADGAIVSANKSAQRLLGLSLEQMQGRDSSDPRWKSVHKDGSFMPGSEHAPQQVLRTKKPYNNQTMGIHKPDGSMVWLNINAQPIIEDGELTGVVTSFFDITERKNMQEELERQLQITDTITKTASSCLFMIDNNGLVTYMNPAATRVTGYSLQESLGKPMHLLIHHSHPDGTPYPQSECPLVNTYTVGAPNPLHEDILYRKDGTSFPALISGTPIPGDVGIQSTVVEFRDIEEITNTLQRNNELEESTLLLKEQRAQLVALNNAKDDFIAIASHQLRTPATAVKQYLGLVLGGFTEPLTEVQHKYITTANDSNERQLNVITDLLKTAKIDSSRYVIRKERTPLASIIEAAITDMQLELDSRDQTVRYTTPKTPILVMVDRVEIKLVLINLLENASKYSYPQSEITVAVSKRNGQVHIDITDNGVGVSHDNVEKIFDKFTRINNVLSDTVTGSGLGLYWVRKIVRLHDGDVKVISKLGAGSTFRVSLPL